MQDAQIKNHCGNQKWTDLQFNAVEIGTKLYVNSYLTTVVLFMNENYIIRDDANQ